MNRTHLILFSGLLLASSFSFAENAPNLSCQLIYSKINPDGTNEAFSRGNNVSVSQKQASDENHGFLMSAKLTQECPRGIGVQCLGDYKLSVTVIHGESSSLIDVSLKNTTGFERYSSALTVGGEQGLVNCDQNI